jgi:hemerythrin-like metal-binding protein
MKATQDMSQPGPGIRPELRDPEAPSPANSASLLWTDARLLGFGPMDTTHEEFYAVAFTLLTCEEAGMLQALDAFETHAREHFEQEDSWMRSTEFPPRDCHIQEHAAVLKSVQEVREHITSGKAGLDLVHHFATYLFQWFPGHAYYLDSALAAWMTKRSLGGKPVVLRRSLKT